MRAYNDLPEPPVDPPSTHAPSITHERVCPACGESFTHEDGLPTDLADCPECGCITDEDDVLSAWSSDPRSEPEYYER